MGASSPEDYGDYYAWGEIETKVEYVHYNSKTLGKSMSDISGNAMYDVASVQWGGSWRLPTSVEFDELITKCVWEWITINGKNGYKVTGPNGKSIFMPAAGIRSIQSLVYAGEDGYYWSSTPEWSNNRYALSLYFNSSSHYVSYYYRDVGRSVRPVSE